MREGLAGSGFGSERETFPCLLSTVVGLYLEEGMTPARFFLSLSRTVYAHVYYTYVYYRHGSAHAYAHSVCVNQTCSRHLSFKPSVGGPDPCGALVVLCTVMPPHCTPHRDFPEVKGSAHFRSAASSPAQLTKPREPRARCISVRPARRLQKALCGVCETPLRHVALRNDSGCSGSSSASTREYPSQLGTVTHVNSVTGGAFASSCC